MEHTVTSGTDDCKPDLLPQHLADLKKSGLTDETIATSGVYSERDPEKVKELLGGYLSDKSTRALGPCLAFPFSGPDGKPMTWGRRDADGRETVIPFVRLKPDRPRLRKGKPVKYESPLGSSNRVYLPPGVGPLLGDPTKELLIVEGEKKALAVTQHGFSTIGLAGVWNWAVKRPKDPKTGRGTGPRKLIDDLDRIVWKNRRVTIVFDSDLAEKPPVAWARWHLAQALTERGADVRVIDLPGGPDGAKCGLDDFLLAHSADALRTLLAAAPAAPPDPACRRARRAADRGFGHRRAPG